MLLWFVLYIFLNCLMCYWSGFRWKDRLRGEFHFVFTIFENSKMAAPNGRTEAERYRSLSERTGVDEYEGYCQRLHHQ